MPPTEIIISGAVVLGDPAIRRFDGPVAECAGNGCGNTGQRPLRIHAACLASAYGYRL